jgi:hypothetical protein
MIDHSLEVQPLFAGLDLEVLQDLIASIDGSEKHKILVETIETQVHQICEILNEKLQNVG